MKERLDSLLVKKGLVRTRSQAQQLIKEGVVKVNSEVIQKPSFKANEGDDIVISKDHLWVGRGAEKLASAHRSFNFSFDGKIVGDMGASTGGFVEYSLFHGAKKVFAVDVGHDQLALSLREDPRVINLEGTNIKDGLDLEEDCDLVVVDLSFISLKLVLSSIISCLRSGGELIVLVKPQFEVGKQSIGKNGIVKDRSAILSALESIYDEFKKLDCFIVDVTACEVVGKTGNQEYFYHCVYEVSSESYSAPEFQKNELVNILAK